MVIDAVICFLWHDPQSPRAGQYVYDESHVYRLQDQVLSRGGLAAHSGVEFICVSDRPIENITTIPLKRTAHMPGTRFAKLMMFDPTSALAGMRFLYLDLDTIVTGDITPLWDRSEDLVLWRNPNYGQPGRARYNTSMILHTGGKRSELYNEFNGAETLLEVQNNTGWGGTDQAWVSYRVMDDEAHWTDSDGVYGAGRLKAAAGVRGDVYTTLPDNARIVFTPGARTPWTKGFAEQHPWAAKYG